MRVHRQLGQLARTITVVCLWALLHPVWAQRDPRLRPVTIALNAQSGNIVFLQFDIARALHFFEDEEIFPQFRYFPGSPEVASALLRGQAQFSGNSIDHAMALGNTTTHLEMVASFTNLPAVSLLIRRPLRPVIRRVEDLRGRRIGISALGSGTHIIANAILASAGVPAASVEFVSIGTGNSLIQAVRAGKVDAVITTDPLAIELLVDSNCSLLLDLVTPDESQRWFHGGYQYTGLLARSDTIVNDPELVQKMVNVVVRANRYIATHSANEIAAILPTTAVNDRFIFIKSLEHTRPSFSQDGNIEPENVVNSLHAYELFSGRHITRQVFDVRFVKQALHKAPEVRE